MNHESCNSFINFCDDMIIANEKLSTRILDRTMKKYMTLYHGTKTKFDMIKATSVNLGNRLDAGSISSFWTNDFTYAKVWALDWRMADGWYAHDIDRNKFLVRTPDGYEDYLLDTFSETLDKNPVYVCEAKIPIRYIGRGQMTINEYTVNHDVIPNKWHEIKWKDAQDVVEFTPAKEFDALVSKYGIDIRRKPRSLAENIIFRNDRKVLRDRANNYQLYKDIFTLKKIILPNKTIQG